MRWLRPLAALLLPFGGGDAVGKLPGLDGFDQGFDGVGLGLGVSHQRKNQDMTYDFHQRTLAALQARKRYQK